MTLKETVDLMLSDDYKDRFRAEYYQTQIRHDKLETMLQKDKKGQLDFVPDCPTAVLEDQLLKMKWYLESLRIRASLEKIEL